MKPTQVLSGLWLLIWFDFLGVLGTIKSIATMMEGLSSLEEVGHSPKVLIVSCWLSKYYFIVVSAVVQVNGLVGMAAAPHSNWCLYTSSLLSHVLEQTRNGLEISVLGSYNCAGFVQSRVGVSAENAMRALSTFQIVLNQFAVYRNVVVLYQEVRVIIDMILEKASVLKGWHLFKSEFAWLNRGLALLGEHSYSSCVCIHLTWIQEWALVLKNECLVE